MPADAGPGMAFVLVQHLAPDHKSILAELIRRYTRMRVFEVEDDMPVQVNCAYIIPPNHDMALLNGSLHLLALSGSRGVRLPIDYFFRSLAADQHARAIAVVLSGTGSDGTLGARAIKGEGGMVMAQSPASTAFDGMPRSVIATGLVDYELAPAEMPAQLIAYAAHAFGRLPPRAAIPAAKSESVLKKIFVVLRSQTGHDFSQYKPSTTHRRIERRMAVHQIEALDSYLSYLQQIPAEVEALFRDLLIGVTQFFRDPSALGVLEQQVIPQLIADKPAGSVVRVWSVGCSTGEEAYSIAMLLQECMDALKQGHTALVFATDIDSRALAAARAGLYPASIAADVSPQRLARFFTAEPDGSAYRIHKSIRDMLIFSEQDVIKDPPFSRLDLISCRNLLIYLGAELQKKLMALFHYALKPGGTLLLGTSEGAGEIDDLFAVLDRKAKLYRRQEDLPGVRRAGPGSTVSPMALLAGALPRHAGKGALPAKPPLRELTEQLLLQQVAAAAALVNGRGDILYLHGRTGDYLEPAPGEAGINNILRMARQGLRAGLSAALHKAVASREAVHAPGLRVKTNGHFITVKLGIHPVTTGAATAPEPPLYLVSLEAAPAAAVEPAARAAGPLAAVHASSAQSSAQTRIASLEEQLRDKEYHLQSTHEELESANQELMSSNEEMQSVNEELQSTNEELETSKEELQSLNEELTTVNTELNTKVADLSRANNDMDNLLAGTGIATVFVDRQLRILRFTPTAAQIINLIPSDIGRPVGHLASNLVGYASLVADAQTVLDTLVARVLDVQTTAGHWYTMRTLPYRTLDNVVEGVVITFVDITERKRVEKALEAAHRQLLRLSVVLRDAHDAITVQDLEGRTIAWNPGAERMYGWSEAEALAMNVRERIPPALRAEALAALGRLSRAEVLEPYRTQRTTKSGGVVEVSMISTALVDEGGHMYAIATTERAYHEICTDRSAEPADEQQ